MDCPYCKEPMERDDEYKAVPDDRGGWTDIDIFVGAYYSCIYCGHSFKWLKDEERPARLYADTTIDGEPIRWSLYDDRDFPLLDYLE